jgi:hypothetical protein
VIDPLTAHTLFQHRHAELVAEADAYRRTRTARKGRPVRRRLRWTARSGASRPSRGKTTPLRRFDNASSDAA